MRNNLRKLGVFQMKKILILTDIYFPKPLANGICIHQLSLTLKSMGYDVHVQCFGLEKDLKYKNYEDIHIHYVKPRLFFRLRTYGEENIDKFTGKLIYKIAMLINKFKKLFFLSLYPITSPLFIWRNYKQSEALHGKYKFDIIISSYNPIEACIGALLLKRKHSNIKWVLYMLDSLTNDVDNRFLSRDKIDSKGWSWEQRFYRYADKILNMKCHEKHHEQKRYEKYEGKMHIVDIPLFRETKIVDEELNNPFDEKNIHFVYTGALALGLRNPTYLCDVFNKLNKDSKFKLHFYSRGNVEDILIEYQNRSKGNIIRHGYVPYNDSIAATYGADILVSIGNANSEMIPSKTFEYISTGKRIIHFYKNDFDSSIAYYEKYPLVLLIDERDDIDVNCDKVKEFLNEPYEKVTFKEIAKVFIKNTPEYTANIIDELVKKQND